MEAPGARSLLRWLLLLSACAVLLARSADLLLGLTVDMAHHYALVVRLYENFTLAGSTDPSLGEMNLYPRLAHQIAAVLGRVVGSPLLGMQLTTLAAAFASWASLGAIMLSLPGRSGVVAACLFILGLGLGRAVHLDLHGAEIAGNFFFAQFVAQSFVLAVLALNLHLERAGAPASVRQLLLGGAVYLAASMHLLPALQIFLIFLGLTVLEIWRVMAQTVVRWRAIAWKALVALGTTVVLMTHPSVAIMRELSGNNGSLQMHYLASVNQVLAYALVLMVGSAALLVLWYRLGQGGKAPLRSTDSVLGLKYLALLGMAISGLCVLQVLALKLGHGSEYAVHKHIFGLHTVMLVLVPTIPLAIWWLRNSPRTGLATEPGWGQATLAWPLLTAAAFLVSMPVRGGLDTSELVRLEHQLLMRRDLQLPIFDGKYNHVQLGGQWPKMVDYMLSIAILQAPRSTTQLVDPGNWDWRVTGSLITLAEQGLDRHEDCRRVPPAGGLSVLDGACLGRKLGQRQVIGFTSNHRRSGCTLTGMSVPESFGTWTTGKNASLQCPLPPPADMQPTRVEIDTTAFLNRVPFQRLRIGLRGQPPLEFRFDSSKLQQTLVLPLPPGLLSHIALELSLPDATAPSALGLGPDNRELGISLRTLEFK